MKLKKKSNGKVVVLSSFFALLAMLGTAVTCPFNGGDTASAAESAVLNLDFLLRSNPAQMLNVDFWLKNTPYFQTLTIDFWLQNGSANYQAVFALLGIDFLLNPTMMIEMDPESVSNASASVTPVAVGGTSVNSNVVTFNVKTTDVSGYNVYLHEKDSNGAALKRTGGGEIPTMTGNPVSTKENIPNGRWGYNFNVTNASLGTGGAWSAGGANNTNTNLYRGLSNNADVTVTTNGGATMNLTYAAKVGYDITPGDYSNTFAVTSVVGANSSATLNAAYRAVDNFLEAALIERPDLREQVEERKAQARANKFEIANDLAYELKDEQE